MNTRTTSGAPGRQFSFKSPGEYLCFYEDAVLGFPLETVCRLNRVRTKSGAVYAMPDETYDRIQHLVSELQATIRASHVVVTEDHTRPGLRLVHGGGRAQE